MKNFLSVLILFSILFTQNFVFAIQREDICVSKKSQKLNSRLKKDYTGYLYEISNVSKRTVNIINAQIINGVDGNIAYNSVEEGGGRSVGILWAICGPVGLFTFGIAWIVGVVGTPIVWLIGDKKDKRAKKESIFYTNAISLGELNSGEMISVMTLAPIGTNVQLKLHFYDEYKKEYKNFIY